jgi:hypothetical protein
MRVAKINHIYVVTLSKVNPCFMSSGQLQEPAQQRKIKYGEED